MDATDLVAVVALWGRLSERLGCQTGLGSGYSERIQH